MKIITGNNFDKERIDYTQEEVPENKEFVVLEFKKKFMFLYKRIY